MPDKYSRRRRRKFIRKWKRYARLIEKDGMKGHPNFPEPYEPPPREPIDKSNIRGLWTRLKERVGNLEGPFVVQCGIPMYVNFCIAVGLHPTIDRPVLLWS